jgi:hypothetical protein
MEDVSLKVVGARWLARGDRREAVGVRWSGRAGRRKLVAAGRDLHGG